MRIITNQEVMNEAANLAFTLPAHSRIYGIPRGGIPAAYAVKSFGALIAVDDPRDANYLIDDIYDSGRTAEKYEAEYGKPVKVLFDKRQGRWAGQWLVMPWEHNELGSTEDIVVRMLQAIGEDPKREGLLDTPRRVNKAWKEWFSGYTADLDSIMTTFDGESYDEMVAVHNIPVWSMCEHHITPFFGIAHVGYIPDGRIVGISKLARVVDAYARRLQVQERLTRQVADCISTKLDAKGVAVIVRCRHMCMHSRGVKMPGTVTTTSAMLGVMNDHAARSEFMRLCDAAERNQT